MGGGGITREKIKNRKEYRMKSQKTAEKLKKVIKDNMDLIIILGITAIIVIIGIITGENLVKRIGPSENTFGLEWIARS